MKKRKPLIIISIVVVIVIIVVILTSCFSKSPSESNVSAPVTDTALIEKQNLVNSISVSGNVEGDNLVKITSTVNSKIKTLNVSIGDSVKKGDVLCTFDSSDFQDEYNSLKETVEKTQEMNRNTHKINQRNLLNAQKEKDAVLAQAQRAIDSAVDARDKAYQKYNDLIGKCNEYSEKKDSLYNQFQESGDELVYQEYQEALQLFTSTETERDTLESQLSTYDDAVQTAQDSYETSERTADSSIQTIQDTIDSEKFNTDNSSQTQLEKLAQKIEDCTVKAPRDGIITSLSVAEGSIPATDAIMTIESNSNLKINVQIKEADILNVKEGMKATIKTDATGDKEFKGTVSKVVNIFSGADPATQTEGGYTAEITVDDSDTSLLIGMNAKVKIITDEKDNVLAVPYDAVSEDNIIYIARQQSDGSYKSEAVTIEKGMESDYYTEIISSEIKEGDLIVLSPQSMHDGRTIRIEETANE